MFITREKLFSDTLEDLTTRLASDKDYDLVRAAGLCRQLILDKKPLGVYLAKKYQYKLQFKVSKNSIIAPQTDMVKWSIISWVTVLPDPWPESEIVALKKFLSITPLKISPYYFNVTEILRAACHCMGGIHSFEPENEKEAVLNNLEWKKPDDHRTNYFAISAICKVILTAMKELENKIGQLK